MTPPPPVADVVSDEGALPVGPKRAGAASIAAWLLRHGRALWIIALVLAVPAIARTASLYAHLRSDVEELLPRESPSVAAIDELRGRLAGLQHLGVVVDVGDAPLEAGERFLDALADRIRAYPSDLAGD